MSGVPESILARLRKVKALADAGVDGEAEAARLQLEKLCAKHGVTLDDLAEVERVEVVKFTTRDSFERMLLVQVLAHVLDSHSVRCLRRGRASFANLTAAQRIDATELYAHYRKELAKERERLFVAFVHRHHLFPKTAKDTEPAPLDLAELAALMAMMAGLRSRHVDRDAPRLELRR